MGYLTTRIGHPEPGTSKPIAAEASTTAGNIFSICRKGRKGDCGISVSKKRKFAHSILGREYVYDLCHNSTS